ncbi:MAG: NfeD family protein [Bdellovibrionales bacterium]|nr:NfeD family protein [Bdellovibrionales bacterium]
MEIDPVSLWIAGGILLLIGEMITAGFFLAFISLGFFGAALAASFHLSFVWQCIICAVLSIIGTWGFRKALQNRLLKAVAISTDVGKEIVIDVHLPAKGQARISYQGTSWLATNLEDLPIEKGQPVTIVGMDGNTLLIRKKNII